MAYYDEEKGIVLSQEDEEMFAEIQKNINDDLEEEYARELQASQNYFHDHE